jgi:hypothetical protein
VWEEKGERKKDCSKIVSGEESSEAGTIVESDIIGVDPELHFVIREKSKLEPQFRAHAHEVTFSATAKIVKIIQMT